MDFYKYNDDKQTSEYLDMLLSHGFMPLITKVTRITHHTQTLIDHIYTNTIEKVVISGICLADITDHLPIFCTLSSKPQTQSEHKMYRDFSKFNAAFIEDLNQIDFVNLVSSDVNESILNVINILQKITDKHAPIKKTPQSKRRQLKKPWITAGILKSIKPKHKLFNSSFLSKDPDKVKTYKKFNNKLNKIKETAKKNYFKQQFEMNKSNLKAIWKLIGMLINRKKNRTQTLSKIVYHNKSYTGKQNICNVLNGCFTNVGPNLADKIPNHQTNPTSYITRPIPNSFVFRSILVHEVSDQIQNININKTAIGIPSICVKLAGNHLSEALTTIYNNSIAQGTVPDILKISKVTPIDKGGDTTDPTNF